MDSSVKPCAGGGIHDFQLINNSSEGHTDKDSFWEDVSYRENGKKKVHAIYRHYFCHKCGQEKVAVWQVNPRRGNENNSPKPQNPPSPPPSSNKRQFNDKPQTQTQSPMGINPVKDILGELPPWML